VADDEARSWVLNNLGMLFNDLGEPQQAEDALLLGLELARARKDRHMEAILLTNRAEGLIAQERWEEAKDALDQALVIAMDGEDPGRIAEILKFRGVLARDQGRLDSAAASFAKALAVARNIHDTLLTAEALREIGILHRIRGEEEGARSALTEALEAFTRLNAKRDGAITRQLIEAAEPQPAEREE
jgi:tetratricopeptide (TPR) repeat protein